MSTDNVSKFVPANLALIEENNNSSDSENKSPMMKSSLKRVIKYNNF